MIEDFKFLFQKISIILLTFSHIGIYYLINPDIIKFINLRKWLKCLQNPSNRYPFDKLGFIDHNHILYIHL